MKVGFVHSNVFQVTGDKVYSVSQFGYSGWTRYLAHFSHVTVMARSTPLSVDYPSGRLNLSSGENVDFVWLPTLSRLSTHWRNRREVKKILRTTIRELDAVIVRMCNYAWMAAAECERQGKPWAVEVVGDSWHAYWNYGTLLGKVMAPLVWWKQRHWVGKAPFAIYVTEKTLQKRYPTHGVQSFASNVQIDAKEVAASAGRLISADTKVFRCGLIGSFVNHYKGLKVAFRALRQVNANGVRLHLHILGEGNLPFWEKLAEDMGVGGEVHWDGILASGEAVLHWLDELDFYIQPSLTEGLPRALVEAMSRGLPALGSSAGGIAELLPSECLHKPGDFRTLAAQMCRMMQDEEWRTDCGRLGLTTALGYSSEVLDARRNSFWRDFANFAAKAGK